MKDIEDVKSTNTSSACSSTVALFVITFDSEGLSCGLPCSPYASHIWWPTAEATAKAATSLRLGASCKTGGRNQHLTETQQKHDMVYMYIDYYIKYTVLGSWQVLILLFASINLTKALLWPHVLTVVWTLRWYNLATSSTSQTKLIKICSCILVSISIQKCQCHK